MLRSKDSSGVLAKLGTVASSIITTEPSVIGKSSVAAGTLAGVATASGFAGAMHVEPNPDAAVRFAEVIARREGAAVLVTGSMYLAGQVRRRWFPDQKIVLAANALADGDRSDPVRCAPTVRWPCTRQSRQRAR